MPGRELKPGELLLVAEAFTGGFYVAVSRGLFVPMLAYSGYSLESISWVALPAGLGGIALSAAVFRRSEAVTSRFRVLLLSSHLLERVLWTTPPFLIQWLAAEAAVYLLGNMFSLLTSLLLGVLIFSYFPSEREVVRVSVQRSAAGAAASLLGALFMTYLPTVAEPPTVYYVLYITAFAVGLMSTVTLLLIPRMPARVEEPLQPGDLQEAAMVKGVNAYLVLVLMNAGGNLVGLAWSPLLRGLNAPLYVPLALSLTGNLGALLGSFAWKSYRAYLAAMGVNTLLTALIPFVRVPEAHPLLSLSTSFTFMGANLLGMQLFAQLSRRLGRVKASVFSTSAGYLGLLLSTALSIAVRMPPGAALLAAASFKLLAVVVAMLAIPETAVVPERRVYEYSRLVYSTSLYGYTFTVQASREFLKAMLEMLATVALVTLIYLVYRLTALLAGV
uniref:MFS transporter n=1 Tax=Thermofilum pendens TaxID=2269 RepID=A0A7J3X896_THEPE